MKKWIYRLLNNLSLLKKFELIFIFCVLLPILCSGMWFMISTNSRISKSEEENLNREHLRISEEVKNIFDTALKNANIVLADPNVAEFISHSYSSEREFYETLIESEMKGYFDRYTSLDDSFMAMTIYTDNYTITDCEVLCKLDDAKMNSIWYNTVKEVFEQVVVVPDEYRGYHGQSDDRTISLVKHQVYNGDDGKINGYIKIDINLNKLARKLNNKNENMFFYLYSEKNKCYVDPIKKVMFDYDTSIKDTVGEYDAFIVDTYISSGRYLSGWKLFGKCEWGYIKSMQRINMVITLLICAGFGLIALLLVYLIYVSNIDRIERLKQGMHDIVSENFNKIEGDCGSDEIADLICSYNDMTDRMNSLINNVYKLEIDNKSIETEKVKAELKYLQSQLNPHFIFNVLSAMHIEALKNGCKQLGDHIFGLASIIRRMLDWTDEFKPLYEEIDFVKTYLNLEKFRFGDKFAYEINADNEALEIKMPVMIVQPLIENSCRHGLQGKTGQRRLRLDVAKSGGILEIKVFDNGKGMTREALERLRSSLGTEDFDGHIGVKNIYKRLRLYFGDKANMEIDSAENEWTCVTLTIKIEESKA